MYSFYNRNNKIVFYGYNSNNKEFLSPTLNNAYSLLNKTLWKNIYFDPKYFKLHNNNEFFSIKNFSFYLIFFIRIQTVIENSYIRIGNKNINNNNIVFYTFLNNNTLVFTDPYWTSIYNENVIINGLLPNETICFTINSGNPVIFDDYGPASIKIIAIDN